MPSGIEPFIDDLNVSALMDRVPVPLHRRDITIGREQTEAIGVEPAHDSSRVAVHCRISIYEERMLGWSIADSKTMCGFGMVVLGALMDVRAGCVRCPEMKRRWMLHAVETMRGTVAQSAAVNAGLLERFTDRARDQPVTVLPGATHPIVGRMRTGKGVVDDASWREAHSGRGGRLSSSARGGDWNSSTRS